jgi:hypothetical protein
MNFEEDAWWPGKCLMKGRIGFYRHKEERTMKVIMIMVVAVLLSACAIVPLAPYYDGPRGYGYGRPVYREHYAPPRVYNGYGYDQRYYRPY